MTFARLRALIIVGVLVVTAIVLMTIALVRDKQAGADLTRSCSADDVPADMRLPEDRATIKLKMFNATSSSGLAGQVGNDFRSRNFDVAVADTNEPIQKLPADVVAELRYGPRTVGAAWLVRAHFLNKAKLAFDINRQDDVIEVVIGPKFMKLGSPTETYQALGAAGKPRLEPGTCDANA